MDFLFFHTIYICMTETKEKQITHPIFENPDKKSEASKLKDIEQPKGEVGGSDKKEPPRFGDWEVSGRCTDF